MTVGALPASVEPNPLTPGLALFDDLAVPIGLSCARHQPLAVLISLNGQSIEHQSPVALAIVRVEGVSLSR